MEFTITLKYASKEDRNRVARVLHHLTHSGDEWDGKPPASPTAFVLGEKGDLAEVPHPAQPLRCGV